jgi:hypothetical protein
MKKLIKLSLAIVLLAGFTTTVMAQVTTPVATNAGAKILTALSIAEVTPMHFGTLGVLAGTGGTCVVNAETGLRSATAGVTLSLLAPLFTVATYTVTGEPLYTYAITLPASITVTETLGGTVSMTIDNLLAKSTSGTMSNTATGTLVVTAGTENFTIGGTLNVTAGQLKGVYAGTFNVYVAYN